MSDDAKEEYKKLTKAYLKAQAGGLEDDELEETYLEPMEDLWEQLNSVEREEVGRWTDKLTNKLLRDSF